jgi:hypothetical protein
VWVAEGESSSFSGWDVKDPRNPALVVVAGGRAFVDRLATSSDVGADGTHDSAAGTADAIALAHEAQPEQHRR